MKILAIIIFALSLSGCGTLGGIASDVNAFSNTRYGYGGNYYSPGPYRFNRGWQSRRGHRW